MAGAPSPEIDMAEQVARILRSIEESQKFSAEQRKLTAEAAKLDRDRALAPWQIVAASMATGAALFGASVAFVKLFFP